MLPYNSSQREAGPRVWTSEREHSEGDGDQWGGRPEKERGIGLEFGETVLEHWQEPEGNLKESGSWSGTGEQGWSRASSKFRLGCSEGRGLGGGSCGQNPGRAAGLAREAETLRELWPSLGLWLCFHLHLHLHLSLLESLESVDEPSDLPGTKVPPFPKGTAFTSCLCIPSRCCCWSWSLFSHLQESEAWKTRL